MAEVALDEPGHLGDGAGQRQVGELVGGRRVGEHHESDAVADREEPGVGTGLVHPDAVESELLNELRFAFEGVQ